MTSRLHFNSKEISLNNTTGPIVPIISNNSNGTNSVTQATDHTLGRISGLSQDSPTDIIINHSNSQGVLSAPTVSETTSNLPIGIMDSKEPSMHNATASSDPTGPEFSYAKQFGMPQLDNATDVFSFFCSGAVIFGGLIPYIPQYIKIKHSMNSDGFSTYVCLTLLLANILRIMFWFGHPFETPLLIQSFVMITGMIAMMELCVRVKKTKSPYVISGATLRSGSSTRRRGNMGNFWEWNNLFSYIKFLSIFTLLLGILTYMLIRNAVYIEGLGFVAVFTESMLGMPQLMRNYRKKSTLGMSVEMVIMWLSGDLFKTLYFILRHAPKQFFICGAIQVTVDIFILAQVLWYRKPGILYSKLPES